MIKIKNEGRDVNLLSKIAGCGVVAVVRADSKEEAVKISEAGVKGGIQGNEVTFTVQGRRSN